MIRRLGVLGGTFDPIHHGHLVAAGEALHQLQLDQVLFVPAGEPPHKPTRPVSLAHHRFRMIELAIAGKPCFTLSRVDLDRPGPSYTVEMLDLLQVEWGPDVTIFFIEGTDSLNDMPTWFQPQRLIELCELAVVARGGVKVDISPLEEQLPGLGDRLHWVEMPRLEISSSDLRARVRAGRPISYLIPTSVESYILEHGLYR
ncbi:MAG TPA: nicotinate-nucleotide adenylyltransferase [Anaerolineae bacterium]|nr:nicotinate-nucleotide adenylyltransferase [Anaerolineae bacterium]